MEFICILTIYNMNYKSSQTYQDIIKSPYFKGNRITIIIADNSTKNCDNRESELLQHHIYQNMQGNKGLAKAYNASIDKIECAENKIVVLFDDDSHLSDDYFERIEEAFIKSKADICIPVVYDQNLDILSPAIETKWNFHRVHSFNEINQTNIDAINSGMAIRSTIFRDYHYDEHYFLDYIDHAFIRDMKKAGNTIFISQAHLYQQFSILSDNYQSTVQRFKISKKDMKYYYGTHRLHYNYIVWRRKLKYLKQFKKIACLWI